jgi:NADH:ubiquinone oxidoreductase subunit 6 (chain J)
METSMIIFLILAICSIVFSIMTVTSTKIMRTATYLLFVLIASAGFYIMLNYHFIAAVQISVYAGGVVVLYVFGILLTSHKEDSMEKPVLKKVVMGLSAALIGVAVTAFIMMKHKFLYAAPDVSQEMNMKEIGHALMGFEKFQYILPFEVLSVLLLACIIGGILIARKR